MYSILIILIFICKQRAAIWQSNTWLQKTNSCNRLYYKWFPLCGNSCIKTRIRVVIFPFGKETKAALLFTVVTSRQFTIPLIKRSNFPAKNQLIKGVNNFCLLTFSFWVESCHKNRCFAQCLYYDQLLHFEFVISFFSEFNLVNHGFDFNFALIKGKCVKYRIRIKHFWEKLLAWSL